jgi:hypothetical protein
MNYLATDKKKSSDLLLRGELLSFFSLVVSTLIGTPLFGGTVIVLTLNLHATLSVVLVITSITVSFFSSRIGISVIGSIIVIGCCYFIVFIA